MALYNVDSNVAAASGYPSFDVAAARASCVAALALSAVCLCGSLASLLCGWTLMMDRLSFLHLACGFWGGLLTTWYLLDDWRWQAAWLVPPRLRARAAGCTLARHSAPSPATQVAMGAVCAAASSLRGRHPRRHAPLRHA